MRGICIIVVMEGRKFQAFNIEMGLYIGLVSSPLPLQVFFSEFLLSPQFFVRSKNKGLFVSFNPSDCIIQNECDMEEKFRGYRTIPFLFFFKYFTVLLIDNAKSVFYPYFFISDFFIHHLKF